MQHIFCITEDKMDKVVQLSRNKLDGEFVVLTVSNGFCDIAQWSDKYQNVKIITLPYDRLNMSMRLA